LWVADPGGHCVHVFSLQGRSYRQIRRIRGTALLSPVGLCLGPGSSVYVCDSQADAVYRLSSDPAKPAAALRLPPELSRPVALDYAAGELFVVDAGSHDIKVLGGDGRLLRIIGQRGTSPGSFNFPCGITGADGMIWVADAGNHRIQGLTRAGVPVASFGQAGDAPGDLALPKDVALDSDGHIYVVDARFENVQIFDRAGRLLLVFGQEGTGPGEFWLPSGIFIDARDRIWICDTYNRRIQVFDYLKPQQAHDRAAREKL